jgi:hypothetical protein
MKVARLQCSSEQIPSLKLSKVFHLNLDHVASENFEGFAVLRRFSSILLFEPVSPVVVDTAAEAGPRPILFTPIT